MSNIEMKRNDRLPDLTATLKQGVGTPSEAPIDLTNATAVKLIMTRQGETTPKVNAAASVVSAAAGTVKYQWAAGDTDTIGTYYCEWEITFPGGKTQTVPSKAFDTIQIAADLG